MEQRALQYADFLGVSIVVNFGASKTAAGWVSCGNHNPAIVNFDASWISQYREGDPATQVYFNHLAAHEVCHVFYKDYECEGPDTPEIEDRANKCAELVVQGIRP